MENTALTALLSPVAAYYTEKLSSNGATPAGVDWNGEASQQLRFKQLCKIIADTEGFSVNDLGCGYGALLHYLQAHYLNVHYTGIDVSAAMIEEAQKQFAGRDHANFIFGAQPAGIADYSVASGIFNVRLANDDEAWLAYIMHTLDILHESSRHGFAFNCLTIYSDAEKMRSNLYYTDPCMLFDHCKRRYSRQVALLHDYGAYEFTLLVRKNV